MAATRDGNRTGECKGKKPNRSCPICGKPADFATRPFCSKRCADVDLYRWLGGAYVVPASNEKETGAHGAERQPASEVPEA